MANPEKRGALSFEVLRGISLYISGFENRSNFAQCSKLAHRATEQRFWELDT